MAQSQDTISWQTPSTCSITTAYVTWALASRAATNTDCSLSGIWIKVTSISGAASLTFKITKDVAGDESIIPETTVTLVTGQATATTGTCVATCEDIILPFAMPNMYLWVKSNAGTATGTEARVTGKR